MARMPKLEAPQSQLEMINDFVMNPFCEMRASREVLAYA